MTYFEVRFVLRGPVAAISHGDDRDTQVRPQVEHDDEAQKGQGGDDVPLGKVRLMHFRERGSARLSKMKIENFLMSKKLPRRNCEKIENFFTSKIEKNYKNSKKKIENFTKISRVRRTPDGRSGRSRKSFGRKKKWRRTERSTATERFRNLACVSGGPGVGLRRWRMSRRRRRRTGARGDVEIRQRPGAAPLLKGGPRWRAEAPLFGCGEERRTSSGR